LPLSGSKKPEISFKKVVFPDEFFPVNAVIVFSSIVISALEKMLVYQNF